MEKKDIIDDPLFKRMVIRKQLSKNTIKNYTNALLPYCELAEMTPSELREEAYKDQIEIPDKLVRNINTHLMDYYTLLTDKRKLNPNSTRSMFNAVRAFYSEYEIDLPKNFRFKVKPKIMRESDIITIKDIRTAINAAPKFKVKAMIALIASSGMRGGDVRKLKIQDFIEATEDYHDHTEIDKIIHTLDGKKIIPVWDFRSEKTNIHTITCSNPESVEYILIYLKTRENANPKEPLFLNKFKNEYEALSFVKMFRDLNDRLGWGSLDNRYRYFHAHGLRDFFSTTLNKVGIPYPIYKRMMGQNMSSVDTAYIHIYDHEVIRREYMKVVNKLSINEIKAYDIKSKEFLDMQEQIDELRKQVEYNEKQREAEMKAELSRENQSR